MIGIVWLLRELVEVHCCVKRMTGYGCKLECLVGEKGVTVETNRLFIPEWIPILIGSKAN